jgi:peptidylamidoglycolate lyase
MKLAVALVATACFFSCAGKKANQENNKSPSAYERVTTWPDLGNGYTLSQPTGIGIDTSDHVFVFHRAGRKWTTPFPDSVISQNTILELDNETGKIIHAWGAGYFVMPHGLTVDKENNVWVTDVALHQIFKFSHDGKLLMKLGTAKTPGNDSLHFNLPTDVAVADNGSFYVSDGYGNSRVAKFSASGKYMGSWGSYGNKAGEFIIPHGIAIDRKQNLYVADRQNNRIQVFDTSGHFIKEIKNDAQVAQLPSITIDKTDQLFAIDYDPRKKPDSTVTGSTIFTFDAGHQVKEHFGITGSADRTTCWLHDIAVDSKGNIYAGDIVGLQILKFKPKN